MDNIPEVVREVGAIPDIQLALMVVLVALIVTGLAVYAVIKALTK